MSPSLTLWLLPDAPAFDEIRALITELSARHRSPAFEPHITLLSGILDREEQALEKAQAIAERFSPISAAFRQVEYLEEYYRCLFFSTTHSSELLQIRAECEQIFEHTNIQPFVPHISFLYGAIPVFQKQAIAEDIARHRAQLLLRPLRMPTLRLVRTQRTPEFWETVAEWTLRENF